MSDQIHELIDSVRTRLHADLDAQLNALTERHDRALAESRSLAESEAEARWTAKLEAARRDNEELVSGAAQRLAGESRHRLLEGLHEIDRAQSISDTLTAIIRAAAREAPRAALFVDTNGSTHEWAVDGASSFIDRERADVSIALVLEGDRVAVLCGATDAESHAPDSWRDGLAAIASHGALRLACVTALKTARAMRCLSATTSASPSSDEEEQSARRYARLLISEIKLYNEGAVRVGREHRDIASRLSAEIERARRMYDQRIPSSVPGRDALFHNELVETLGGGDATLFCQVTDT